MERFLNLLLNDYRRLKQIEILRWLLVLSHFLIDLRLISYYHGSEPSGLIDVDAIWLNVELFTWENDVVNW